MERDDEKYMKMALQEAEAAAERDEVPVGAVIVCNGMVIARAHNLTETLNDVTAHAEMQAITMATNYLGGKYLDKCSIYVTVEPCPMCAAALAWAQVGEVIYGTPDKKRGYSLFSPSLLHPKTVVRSSVLETECADIISNFFRDKR